MNTVSVARLAMPIAGFMIAHHVAARAIRDATFLGAWPVARLPAMVIATSAMVVAAVPLYSRLLERFGPRAVVSFGFLASAAAHVLESQFLGTSPWVAVVIYLHVAGLSVLLLSGFWSLISELFDPKAAKSSYGRIAAAGTIGGLAGGIAAAQSGETLSETGALLLLAFLHACCAVGVFLLGQTGAKRPERRTPEGQTARVFEFGLLRAAPHLKTLALIVILGTAGAAIADYLLKMQAVEHIGTDARLRQFFAVFYVVVQIATFLAQFAVGAVVRRFGLGRTISALPGGVGVVATLGLLYPEFPIFISVRGVESVLRGSFFRSAYELIFVPMAPEEKHRTKTFLDVTCDRLGDAVGAGVVQLMLVTTALIASAAVYLSAELLAIVIAMSVWSLWLASRLDALYLGVVERRLTAHGGADQIVVGSETGWTVLDLAQVDRQSRSAVADAPAIKPPSQDDPKIRRLADLRSGDRVRVQRSLAQLTHPDSLEIAQVVQLLAWDDLVASARKVLESSVASHLGLLTDTLLDPDTDFAIRRRVPRILGVRGDRRALEGLVAGLDDTRFEVRYQCSRAIHRIVAHHPHLAVDTARLLAVVEREVSVPSQTWHGYRLIDHVDRDEDTGAAEPSPAQEQRNIEHVFSLLAVVLPPEPLTVALHGIRSNDAALRGVAIEYLESVLPTAIWSRLWVLLEGGSTPSSGDVPAQSDPRPPATPR